MFKSLKVLMCLNECIPSYGQHSKMYNSYLNLFLPCLFSIPLLKWNSISFYLNVVLGNNIPWKEMGINLKYRVPFICQWFSLLRLITWLRHIQMFNKSKKEYVSISPKLDNNQIRKKSDCPDNMSLMITLQNVNVES